MKKSACAAAVVAALSPGLAAAGTGQVYWDSNLTAAVGNGKPIPVEHAIAAMVSAERCWGREIAHRVVLSDGTVLTPDHELVRQYRAQRAGRRDGRVKHGECESIQEL